MEKLTMTVKEMGKLVGVSLPKAYEITEQIGCPVFHVGRKKLIPIEPFRRWFEQQAANKGA